jgi:chorismate-pyruvate lyase
MHSPVANRTRASKRQRDLLKEELEATISRLQETIDERDALKARMEEQQHTFSVQLEAARCAERVAETSEMPREGTIVQLREVTDPILKGAYAVVVGAGQNDRMIVVPLVTQWGEDTPTLCEASPTFRISPHRRSRRPVSVLSKNTRLVPRGTHDDADFRALCAAVLVEACLASHEQMPTPNELPSPLLWEGGACTKALQMAAGALQIRTLVDILVADQQRRPHATTGVVRPRKISKLMRLHTHPDRVSGRLAVCAKEGSVDPRVAQAVMRVVTAVFHTCG